MKWITLRRRKLPFIFPVPFYYLNCTKSKLKIKRPLVIVKIMDRDWTQEAFSERAFLEKTDKELKKVITKTDYIRRCDRQGQKFARQFLTTCKKKFNKDKLERLSLQKLLGYLNNFIWFYSEFFLINVIPWLFASDKLAEYIKQTMLQLDVKEKEVDAVFMVLSTPTKDSYVKKEERDFLKLLLLIQKSKASLIFKNFSNFKKQINNFPKVKKAILKQVQNYSWIPFDYVGPARWDLEFYFKKIKDCLKSRKDPQRKLDAIEKNRQKLIQKQKKLLKKHKISFKAKRLLRDLQILTLMQDYKKEVCTIANVYYQYLLKEIKQRTGIGLKSLYYMSPTDLRNALKSERPNLGKIKQRIKFSLVEVKEGKLRILESKEAKNYIAKEKLFEQDTKKVKEIKGLPASMGKVKGIVKVLFSAKEINKINQGEILVATMTTPDYVPAMKKSIAIITDEGGITCHAAIVSRELNIPCIIGTKIATEVLKDGDLVEVDANRGIVRILKK